MKKWFAIKKNDEKVDETMVNWNEVKSEVKSLSFDNNGQIISLPVNMESYIQGKTASAFVGSKHVQIESRYIGFKNNNETFIVRIDEKTSHIQVEHRNN